MAKKCETDFLLAALQLDAAVAITGCKQRCTVRVCILFTV